MSQKQSSPSLSGRCDSDPLHRRPVAQSKKNIQTNSANQKKLVGRRISTLESQLGQAQEELKIMKFQLNPSDNTVKKSKIKSSVLSEISKETDVFEVPIPIEGKHERSEEINVLKAMLEGKEKELEISLEENERLKMAISADQAKEEEMLSRLIQLVEESKDKRRELILKLEGMEAAKEEMESEMKKLRIQTEQWRKAVDAAAAALVLSEAGKKKERRGGSMDKQYGNIFENPVSNGGYYYNNIADDDLAGHGNGNGNGNGKRRGSGGIRMLGELWKKKGQK